MEVQYFQKIFILIQMKEYSVNELHLIFHLKGLQELMSRREEKKVNLLSQIEAEYKMHWFIMYAKETVKVSMIQVFYSHLSSLLRNFQNIE